jgi:hypothetical protein
VVSTRDFRCTARVGAAAGLILFTGLLIGAGPAAAAPAAPTGVAVPVAPPLPPKPCAKNVICHPPTLEPCFTTKIKNCQPTATLTPPSLQPCLTTKPEDCQPSTAPSVPTSEPSTPPQPGRPATPAGPPAAIPTPNRIDTGGTTGGATETAGPDHTSWVLWAVPAGALVILAAGLVGAWLARSEQDPRR